MILRNLLAVFSSIAILSIPSVAFASSSSDVNVGNGSAVTIRVSNGQTLWSISTEYHVSVRNLESWNHLNDNSILHVGDKLIVGYSSAAIGAEPLSARSDAGSSVLGFNAVQYAEQFVGVPYAWGGESTSGFDCSGLVRFVYGHFGISLPRDSYSQYQTGAYVSRDNLMPGDLVFFSSYGSGPSHVGIYVGGGRFVNAASGGVQVNSMASSYWANCYYGARRVQ